MVVRPRKKVNGGRHQAEQFPALRPAFMVVDEREMTLGVSGDFPRFRFVPARDRGPQPATARRADPTRLVAGSRRMLRHHFDALAIPGKRGIVREEDEWLGSGLRHEHAVEGISVDRRQKSDGDRMIATDRQ